MFCAICGNIYVKNSKVINGLIENKGNSNTGSIGMLVGVLRNGRISKSSVQGRILNFNKFVGGFVGQNFSYGNVKESFSDIRINLGNLGAGQNVGGFWNGNF